MKKKWIAILMIFTIALSLVACDAGEETTLTGMVVSVDGTTISLVEMDMSSIGSGNTAEGNRPQMPEGMDGFSGFNPGSFGGQMPEGGSFPQWGSGEMPDGFTMPDGFDMPEGFTMPEGMDGSQWFGGNGGFDSLTTDAETKEIDIGKAHISVEIDGGKASGSMDDIQAGTFVTITIDGKGNATYVLVSSTSFRGNGGRPAK